MKFGIDISEFQAGADYAGAKAAGVTFAILRAGYGREAATQKDEAFEVHYAGFRAQGVPLGAYQYSYATDLAGAEKEAAAMLTWCGGKAFGLPLYLDMEEGSIYRQGAEVCTAMALRWCEKITAAGYRAGVYASSSWFGSVLNADKIRAKGYSLWIADWGSTAPAGADIWQFGGETNLLRSKAVTGIPGTCDQNYLIRDAILPGTTAKTEITVTKKEENTVNITLTVLEEGSEGAQVKTLQRLLIARGYNCGGYGADGKFGSGTLASVKAFQTAQKIDVDGIVGHDTWTRLLTA